MKYTKINERIMDVFWNVGKNNQDIMDDVFCRLKAIRKTMLKGYVFLVVLLLAVIFGVLKAPLNLIFAGLSIGALTMGMQYLYDSHYRKNVTAGLVQEIEPGCRYEHNRMIQYKDLTASWILPYHTQEYGSDYIQTQWFGQTVQLCNLRLVSGSSKSTVTVFDGCFVRFDLKTKTKVAIVFKDKSYYKFFSKTSFRGKKIEPLRLIAPDLNKAVEIWTDDQITARTILQPALLLKLQNIFQKHKVLISIVDNEINFAIQGLKLNTFPRFFMLKPFELKLRKQLLRESMETVKSIVETLNFHQVATMAEVD